MPFDPESAFAPVDQSQWQRTRALPHIVVRPNAPPSDGVDDWFVPGDPRTDPSYPDDWFVPPRSFAPNTEQPAPGPQPNAANAGFFSTASARPDPFAAYWSLIPASRVGAMAWDPPNLPLFPSSTDNFAPSTPPSPPPFSPGSWPRTLGVDTPPWSSTRSLPNPAIPQGGLLDLLATLGTSPAPWSAGEGGLLGALATLGTPPPTSSGGSLLGALATLGTPSPAAPASSLAGGSFPGPGRPASPPMPNAFDAFFQGLGSGTRQVAQTIQRVSGPPTIATQDSPAAEPLGWSDLTSPSRIAPKVAYQFAQSYPTLAAGVAGGVIGGRLGALAGPEGAAAGALIGGSLGAAALSAAQTLGPAYAAELQKTPNDPEGAWKRAWTQAEISGAFSGASWAVFPAAFFKGPVKHLVFQMFGAQPALAVGQRVTSNIVEGKPVTEGIGEAYGQGVLGTAMPALGHGAVGLFLPGHTPATKLEFRRSSFDEPTVGLSPAEDLRARRAAQLRTNRAAGAAWEDSTNAGFDREVKDVAPQLTVELPSRIRIRLDFVTRNRVTGEFGRVECKGSQTAPIRPKQIRAFREMEHSEATIMGKGKPGFPGGMKIPPGRVEIRRPRK